MSALCRMKVDLPPMFGPVMSHMRFLFRELEVVGDEGSVESPFHDRMPAAFYADALAFGEFGRPVVERIGALREVHEDVDLGHRQGAFLQLRQTRAEDVQNLLVERLLPCQRPLACPQHPVLEALQLFADVALGMLEGLPARVFRRCPLGTGCAQSRCSSREPGCSRP